MAPIMPSRRQSIPTSSPSASIPSSSTPRQRGAGGGGTPLGEVRSWSMQDTSLTNNPGSDAPGDPKIVTALVGRLVNKLPCNSGTRLRMMEVDPAVQHTVQSLLKLARIRPGQVVYALTSALETLSKYSSSTNISDTSLDTLQSQLYILYILHLSLAASWRSQAEQFPSPSADLPRCWPDPSALEDGTARYVLSVLLTYIRLVSSDSQHIPGTASPAPSREGKPTLSSTSWYTGITGTTHGLGPRFIQSHSYPAGSSTPPPDSSADRQLSSRCHSIATTADYMTRITARIVFHVTSSNWPRVLSVIKARISRLTTTIDDNPDMVELRLLEWGNVDRIRLSQTMQEVSSSFLHVKRPAQIAIASVLRKCIWNFVQVHPTEYETLVEANRKLEGGADMLFDILSSATDLSSSSQARRTKVFYPLMAMLLVICPDIFKKAVMGDGGGRSIGGLGKKVAFLESLRKGISATKSFEPCTVCYVDIARAAMALSPRLEASGARSLVDDIQNDLKNALFYSQQSSEISDPTILVDGLVALYRVNPVSVTGLLFGKLFADSNENNQIVAVRACVQIILEDARLPWYPSAEDLRDKVSAAIRSVLKGQLNNLVGDFKMIRRPRYAPELPTQNDLIVEILRLYTLNPSFARAATANDPNDVLSNLLLSMSALIVSPVSDGVRRAAARAIAAILYSLVDCPESDLTGCEDAFWRVLTDAGRQGLFAVQSDPSDIDLAFDAFREISVSLATLAEAHPDVLAKSPKGEPAVLLGLVTIISVLISPDFEQLTQSIPTFKALRILTLVAHSVYFPGESPSGTNFSRPETRILMRCILLDDLAKLPPANGRQQQQRQFRKAYKPYIIPSTAGVAVWLGLASVAKDLTARINAAESSSSARDVSRRGLAPDIDGLDENQSKMWQNITLFLASTASMCSYDTSPPPPFIDSIGRGILPRTYEEFPDPMVACEGFIEECVHHLLNGSIHVRETAKEALGAELPGVLARTMVSKMTQLLAHCRGPNGINTSLTFTTLVEQILSILRLTISRSPVERSGSGGMQADLSELVLLLVQYIHRMGKDDIAIRSKIRFCQIIENVPGCEGVVLGGADGGNLKNTLLERLVEWSVEATRDADAKSVPETSSRLFRELDHFCLRAIVPVSEGLVLKPNGDDTSNAAGSERSHMFYRYYHHLVKIIERAIAEEEISSSSALSRPHDDAPGLAISVLSNLLSSNVDVGLKHCLVLGYHEDPSLRSAFMRLISNILQQGTGFGGLSTKRMSGTPKVYLETLTGTPNNLALAVSICEVCTPSEVDEISLLLFRVFEAKGTVLNIVKLLVEKEIATTNQEHELFRGNSITTRMLTIFAKTYGYNYVRATLQPLIHSLCERPSQSSYELDPAKVGPNDDPEKNADDLQLMCQALLDLICSSSPRTPVLFKALCGHLVDTIEMRYPESRHSVIGSFIFLRFFCPAIVAPENVDLDVSPDTREIRRALLLITKIIQNLANNITFGNKEPHMKALNGFLTENIRQVTKFLLDIADKPKPWETAAAIKTYQDDAERLQDLDYDENILHRFIHRHQAKIENSLAHLPPTYRCEPGGAKLNVVDLDGKAAQKALRGAVDLTGPPVDAGGLGSSARSQAYDEFMRHNAGRNTESVSSAFYEGPLSQNGRRIFYFVIAHVALLDYDLLAYHIYSILDDVTDFFDLVIDLTEFSAKTELPMAWLKRSIQMCPPGVLPLINVLALYNPNGYARRRVRRIMTDLATIVPQVGKTVVAASSPSELAEFIRFTTLSFPQFTMALAFEADHVFTNLLCLSDHDQQVPVVVKLGHDVMQVASWRKTDFTPTLKSYIIDVIRLRDIDDILTGPALPNDFLVIKYSQTETVTFVSRRRDEMAQVIRLARSKLQDGPSEERTLRPSDVPGTLLNVALLNLSSDDPTLRLGAYNLIAEIVNLFKYDLNVTMLKVNAGLTIPNNALAFTQSLSSSLATTTPHLTVEFLKEWCLGFNRADFAQRSACLQYVGPWLANLDTFARPTKDHGVEYVKDVEEIIRSLISITVTERRRLHLSIQEQVWSKLGRGHNSLVELIVETLIQAALDAGFGSEKAEVAADILGTMANTVVRGRLVARLRKTLAQTYLKPSSTLTENAAWPEIATLSRIILTLSFCPSASLDLQLFLPEIFHIVTLMTGTGPVLIRQTVYGITVNLCHSLATTPSSVEMNFTALHQLFIKLQSEEMVSAFGLVRNPSSDALTLKPTEGQQPMDCVEQVTKFLSELLDASAISIDCGNAWRARWMGLVTQTCFQHNPATQPQAFTVLGYLASEEVDDDLVYQILVAMSSTLSHFSETDDTLLIAMIRCLSRVIPGLSADSRYAISLFWLAIGILQLGHIPPFATALELLLVSLKAMNTRGKRLFDDLVASRRAAGEIASKMDTLVGVSFESNVTFSLVATMFKGARHPHTRTRTIAALTEFLRLASADTGPVRPREKRQVVEEGVPFFVALLPLLAGQAEELKALWEIAGLSWEKEVEIGDINVLKLLSLPDNSTALLVVMLVVTILQGASSDYERIVLYRFLADASIEMPELVSMMYDSLIPRMTAVLSTTSSVPILRSVTNILEIAMKDPAYTFPSASLMPSDSTSTLNHQYAASMSSGISGAAGAGVGKEQLLENLGMKALGELSFGHVKLDEVARLARWVAALVDAFTL